PIKSSRTNGRPNHSQGGRDEYESNRMGAGDGAGGGAGRGDRGGRGQAGQGRQCEDDGKGRRQDQHQRGLASAADEAERDRAGYGGSHHRISPGARAVPPRAGSRESGGRRQGRGRAERGSHGGEVKKALHAHRRVGTMLTKSIGAHTGSLWRLPSAIS